MNVYEYWFATLEGISNRKKIQLLNEYRTEEQVFALSKDKIIAWNTKVRLLSEKNIVQLTNKSFKESAQLRMTESERAGICLTVFHSKEYPRKLLDIPDPPYAIFFQGTLPSNEGRTVAIIGARECSAYGMNMARKIGYELGKQGIQVISGMARGIDGIAQNASLQAKGTSFAVLGCGVDVCYPEDNQELYLKLKSSGGVLSECPPHTRPQKHLFPARNRIISGLSDVVLVIEARKKSGTLITVEMALEQGKDVYVLPGRITDGLSEGCNLLLREGAAIFLSVEQFLEDYYGQTTGKQLSFFGIEELSSQETIVYIEINYEPVSINELYSNLSEQLSMQEMMKSIVSLEMKGIILRVGPGRYVRNQ